MTAFRAPSGTSSTEATRTLANAVLQLGGHQVARVLERNAVEHIAEESLDEHPLGGFLGDSTRAQVKEVIRIDGADGCAVGTAHVVVVDLEHRDAGGLRLVR